MEGNIRVTVMVIVMLRAECELYIVHFWCQLTHVNLDLRAVKRVYLIVYFCYICTKL